MIDLHARMVKEIADAIYPILYPIEQADCKIQAEHWGFVEHAARCLWAAWLVPRSKNTQQHLLGLQERLQRVVKSGHQGPIIIVDGDARLILAIAEAELMKYTRCGGEVGTQSTANAPGAGSIPAHTSK